MSHVTYEWVMSHTNELCQLWMSHVTYEWVMSHVWHTPVCHTYVWMCHITYMNESRHVSKWVMSHLYKSCVTYMNEAYLM